MFAELFLFTPGVAYTGMSLVSRVRRVGSGLTPCFLTALLAVGGVPLGRRPLPRVVALISLLAVLAWPVAAVGSTVPGQRGAAVPARREAGNPRSRGPRGSMGPRGPVRQAR